MKTEMKRRHYEKPQMLAREIEACLMLANSDQNYKARTEKLEDDEEVVWE